MCLACFATGATHPLVAPRRAFLLAAGLGSQLAGLQFSRSDETETETETEAEADLVGLELAARAGYPPAASVGLWQKMSAAAGSKTTLSFLSTHPSGPERIRQLQASLPQVQGLYQQAVRDKN